MVTGATSLSLVRDELFATMEQAEQGLEQFIAERQNGSLLQHAVECLQQIRGTLNLIELAGAELLAQEAQLSGSAGCPAAQRTSLIAGKSSSGISWRLASTFSR